MLLGPKIVEVISAEIVRVDLVMMDPFCVYVNGLIIKKKIFSKSNAKRTI